MRAFVIESAGVKRFPDLWWCGRSHPTFPLLPCYDWTEMRPIHYYFGGG